MRQQTVLEPLPVAVRPCPAPRDFVPLPSFNDIFGAQNVQRVKTSRHPTGNMNLIDPTSPMRPTENSPVAPMRGGYRVRSTRAERVAPSWCSTVDRWPRWPEVGPPAAGRVGNRLDLIVRNDFTNLDERKRVCYTDGSRGD